MPKTVKLKMQLDTMIIHKYGSKVVVIMTTQQYIKCSHKTVCSL